MQTFNRPFDRSSKIFTQLQLLSLFKRKSTLRAAVYDLPKKKQ
jgi:hypothetical protein